MRQNRWLAWARERTRGRGRLERARRTPDLAFLRMWRPAGAARLSPARPRLTVEAQRPASLGSAVQVRHVTHRLGSVTYRLGAAAPGGLPPAVVHPPRHGLSRVVFVRGAAAGGVVRGLPEGRAGMGSGGVVGRMLGELVARVAQGYQRVERPAGRQPMPGMVHAAPFAASPSGAPFVSAPAAVQGRSPAGPWSRPGGGQEPATGPGAAQGGAVPVDLERLADQIVNRLDDRLIAQRERLGRAF
ncbi:hypothetical protein [Nonomuraea sp. NPDC046570]|uniref:hypothetical protein n=1 Tax=Nonomuraea sp. NPDC046570 TaxID=3155255 RepID=UPI0033D37471